MAALLEAGENADVTFKVNLPAMDCHVLARAAFFVQPRLAARHAATAVGRRAVTDGPWLPHQTAAFCIMLALRSPQAVCWRIFLLRTIAATSFTI